MTTPTRLMALRNRAMPMVPVVALLLAMLAALLGLWAVLSPARVATVQHVPATPAAAVATLQTVATPIKTGTVRAYPAAAKKALKLPETIQAAPEQQVIAANTVAPSEHAYTLTTLVDTETGEVRTLARAEPLPWLARDASGRLDLLLGQSNEGPVARLSATQNLLQVKSWHLGVAGAVTQHLGGRPETDWLVGINLGTSW